MVRAEEGEFYESTGEKRFTVMPGRRSGSLPGVVI